MGGEFLPGNRAVLHFRSARNPLGNVITRHAFDGLRRYSIDIRSQPFDRTVYPVIPVHRPIVHGTGVEPTFAQKVVAL